MAPQLGTAGWGAPALVLDAAATSIAGPRSDNQDAACAGPHLLAVADGVGGNVGGATAAALVIGQLAARRRGADDEADAGLGSAVAAASGALRAAIARTPRLAAMATTLTVAALTPDGRLAVAHVGDSRAYLLRDGQLLQLTHDQTLVQALVDAGTITAELARTHALRALVLAALHGTAEDAKQVVMTSHDLVAGDRLLVCSDGLTGFVEPDMISRILIEEHRPAEAVARLLRASLAAGTKDNVTAAVADVAVVGSVHPAWPTVVGAAATSRRSGATTMPVG